MAETMMPPRLMAWIAAALLAASGAARAQDDPTRPPANLAAPAGESGQASAPATGPQVQSILVSLRPGGRRVAVIDGKTRRQGDRIGDAVLETIRPTEVVLRRGKQRQVLKLFRPAMPGATA